MTPQRTQELARLAMAVAILVPEKLADYQVEVRLPRQIVAQIRELLDTEGFDWRTPCKKAHRRQG